MTCWKCGRTINLRTAQKINTRDECECGADLHVCRNCSHFDLTAHNECREVMAEWVRNKDRANYCDYFAPSTASSPASAQVQDKNAADEARAKFDQLFKL